jgi:hypothetical protein
MFKVPRCIAYGPDGRRCRAQARRRETFFLSFVWLALCRRHERSVALCVESASLTNAERRFLAFEVWRDTRELVAARLRFRESGTRRPKGGIR